MDRVLGGRWLVKEKAALLNEGLSPLLSSWEAVDGSSPTPSSSVVPRGRMQMGSLGFSWNMMVSRVGSSHEEMREV